MNARISFVFMTIALLYIAGAVVSASPVTENITYQGKLTDPTGIPLNGTYAMTFRLYNAATGGTALATSSNTVTCANGSFTTSIPFDSAFYDGRGLWLGVTVGADAEMTPRQQLQPVPYSLGLKPGAWIVNQDADAALNLRNEIAGTVLNVTTAATNSTAIYTETSSAYSPGITVKTKNLFSPGISIETTGYSSPCLDIKSQHDRGLNISAEYEGIVVKAGSAGHPAALFENQGKTGNPAAIFTSTGNSQAARFSASGLDHTVLITSTNASALWVSTSSSTEAVHIITQGQNAAGIEIDTYGGPNSDGIDINTQDSNSNAITISSNGLGPDTHAIDSWCSGDYGIVSTMGNDTKYGFSTNGYVSAHGTKYPSSDVAEYMPVTRNVTPGTILIIGPDGRLQPADTAYDTRVAGIVSTDPGVWLGTKEEGNEGEALIAVSGRVPCLVDASYGAIHAGDILTTSATPGHAMKATDARIGTVLGKAMGSLESGTGTITVLVTLQ